jgi:subtilase family protein
LAKVVATVGSRLPEVASNTGTNASAKSTSESDRTMSRLGGPEQPSSEERSSGDERRVGRSRAQKKDDDSDGDGGSPAKSTVRELGRRVAGSLLPPPGTFRQNEVLAVNLSAPGLARALQRNFKVLEKVEYPALGFNLTRLATPDTQNAIIGRSTLHEELPADGFGLNHIYATGRTGATVPSGTVPSGTVPSGPDAGGGAKAAAVPSNPSPGVNLDRRAGACAPDRCFGISVINWQPQLAACARGIKIGIIDTGVDKNHPAFAGIHFKHEDFVPSNSKKPSNHHGTGVFSLLAGNPRSSTPGLVPDATFLFGDAFFADRNGNAMSDTITMLKALNWLKGAGVDIANLSFAGPPDELVHDAIKELAKTGTVILAAAGNEGQDAPPSYPAAYKEVIAVTAVDRNLAPYAYANRGSHIDVAAPGVDVWTALPNRREGLQTGTSFAVPFVTSVVALSYRPEERTAHTDPLAPKRQALAQLQKNIKVIGGRGQAPIFGAGLVQAPSHCDPRWPAIVAKADRWNGTVQAAPPANAPNPVQAGSSWTSTVHPVASRK